MANNNSKEIVRFLAKSLVCDVDKVSVNETEGPDATIIELNVAQEDMGRVIGKQGKIAKAIRTIVRASVNKAEKPVFVEIQ